MEYFHSECTFRGNKKCGALGQCRGSLRQPSLPWSLSEGSKKQTHSESSTPCLTEKTPNHQKKALEAKKHLWKTLNGEEKSSLLVSLRPFSTGALGEALGPQGRDIQCVLKNWGPLGRSFRWVPAEAGTIPSPVAFPVATQVLFWLQFFPA